MRDFYILKNIYNNNLPIYTIVRNPFTHIHSYFFHKIKFGEIKVNSDIDIVSNFEEFCRKEYNNVHLQQYNYVRSNKKLKPKIFKFEEGIDKVNNYILKKHNIDLKLCKSHYNKNTIKPRDIDIKLFFRNKEIVDLITSVRRKEFDEFNYSKNIDDIIFYSKSPSSNLLSDLIFISLCKYSDFSSCGLKV